jgi:SAM-dependent methyltransferase
MVDSSSDTTEYRQLIAEQKRVQETKTHTRPRSHYSNKLFPTGIRGEDSSAVEDFLERYCGERLEDIGELIDALYRKKQHRIEWVDMGGGKAVTMRQLARSDVRRSYVHMTNVDLLDRRAYTQAVAQDLERRFPTILHAQTEPDFIQTNSETVKLLKPADLITSMESIQYLNDPVRALCNWYNQLTDDGLLIVVTEHRWSDDIRSTDIDQEEYIPPMNLFLQTLTKEGVHFAASSEHYNKKRGVPSRSYETDGFFSLVLQKTPNTKLSVGSTVQTVKVSADDYKWVYYATDQPIITVEHTAPLPKSS